MLEEDPEAGAAVKLPHEVLLAMPEPVRRGVPEAWGEGVLSPMGLGVEAAVAEAGWGVGDSVTEPQTVGVVLAWEVKVGEVEGVALALGSSPVGDTVGLAVGRRTVALALGHWVGETDMLLDTVTLAVAAALTLPAPEAVMTAEALRLPPPPVVVVTEGEEDSEGLGVVEGEGEGVEPAVPVRAMDGERGAEGLMEDEPLALLQVLKVPDAVGVRMEVGEEVELGGTLLLNVPLLQALPVAAAGVAVAWAFMEGEGRGELDTEGLPVARRDAEFVPEALTERLAWGLAVPMPPAPTVVGVAGALKVREAVGETLGLEVALLERPVESLG